MKPSASTPEIAAPCSELATAVRVARTLLADYGDATGYDLFQYAQAHGGLSEALRILLQALDAEPVSTIVDTPRCPAAHPEDPTPCNGPVVVTVLDSSNAGADGCEHHAVRLLASLTGGRPVPKPDAPAGLAVRLFRAAHSTRPFPWREGL
ncbi:hypothetical protein AB0G64_11130 [Streptomyces longwoodensis]|uniref:hypothetical protein n=1 Tax=Streptomyces longwoodensis TaxID=68231 RepID=UPI0033F176F1